jgi:CHAT domain-containing protein
VVSPSNVLCQVVSTDPPHIWWCPTGPLAFLPIHAAGLYNQGAVEESISDYVVSSYTPTLTALLGQERSSGGSFHLLTVALPFAPYAQYARLPGTEKEVARIQSLATGLSPVTLVGEDATVQRVVDGMEASDWIHLACHGEQVISNAMASGLLLHDKRLELSEMIKMALPRADFAFLSACQTAVGDEKLAEESVHLASGMLFAGYRGLIATMWSINDKDAPQIAEDVYREILKGGKPNRKEAARALHEAVKRLREESKAELRSWVPFIHIGR